jgi:hypothetical protein
MLEFVAGSTDLVKVKNQYTILYETWLLMLIYWLSHPHRVWCDMEVKFGQRWGFISGVCGTFIDALYAIALPYFSDPGLSHHRFLVYTENIAEKTGYTAINVWGFINRTLKKMCWPTHSKKQPTVGTMLPRNKIPKRSIPGELSEQLLRWWNFILFAFEPMSLEEYIGLVN